MLYPTELLVHIQLGYPCIVAEKRFSVNKLPHIFCPMEHILSGRLRLEGGSAVRETDDSTVDLEDLLFEDEDWHPSER